MYKVELDPEHVRIRLYNRQGEDSLWILQAMYTLILPVIRHMQAMQQKHIELPIMQLRDKMLKMFFRVLSLTKWH